MAVALLGGATGCGGSGDDDDDAESAASIAREPEAQERAETIVLQLSDFPDGWRASAPESEEQGQKLRECIGIDYSGLTRIGDADSQDFASGESEAVLVGVGIRRRSAGCAVVGRILTRDGQQFRRGLLPRGD